VLSAFLARSSAAWASGEKLGRAPTTAKTHGAATETTLASQPPGSHFLANQYACPRLSMSMTRIRLGSSSRKKTRHFADSQTVLAFQRTFQCLDVAAAEVGKDLQCANDSCSLRNVQTTQFALSSRSID
jgi:hypothetical protein